MKHQRIITVLVYCIALTALLATTAGIFSRQGPGPYTYESIRGLTVPIYGTGVYQHMSAEVAPQGIAQDWVTLCLSIPLLLLSLARARKGSLRGLFILTGVLGYFLVTYLFYTTMGMYNVLFLAYVFLLSCSFFAFSFCFHSYKLSRLPGTFRPTTPVRPLAIVLLSISLAIAALWLSIIIPPLLDGSIFPKQVEHYTTLIVQGLDLALLLPIAAVSAILLFKKNAWGYLLTPVYFTFLSLLMTALTAKVIAMALLGYEVIPVIFIIPAFNVLSVSCLLVLLHGLKQNATPSRPWLKEKEATALL